MEATRKGISKTGELIKIATIWISSKASCLVLYNDEKIGQDLKNTWLIIKSLTRCAPGSCTYDDWQKWLATRLNPVETMESDASLDDIISLKSNLQNRGHQDVDGFIIIDYDISIV